MNRQKIIEYLDSLIGRTLENISLSCEMMMFKFGEISIHSQCFTRIIYKDQILLTTFDYQNQDGVTSTNNDEWYNLSRHKELITCNKVVSADLSDTRDVIIRLGNDVLIQIFVSNSQPHYMEDSEQWRIFEKNKDVPHIVVYSNSIRSE